MQRAKEMRSSNQANFYTNPQKSEINGSSTFKQLSVPIQNDIPASTTMSSFLSQLTVGPTYSSSHFHVPTNATRTTTGVTSLSNVIIAHVSAMTATTAVKMMQVTTTRTATTNVIAEQLELSTRQEAQAFYIPPRKRLTMQLKEISCCFLFKTI